MSNEFGRRTPQQNATSAAETQRGADKPVRVGVRLDPVVATNFRLVSMLNGESMNTVLVRLVRNYIAEHGVDPDDESPALFNKET